MLISFPVLAFGQKKQGRFIDTCKMESYSMGHDRKSDFTVICHGGKCDTVRNGVYEYQLIKKRVKKQ